MFLYAIRDSKSELFTRPYGFHNDGMAMRSFEAAVAGADDPMSAHPEDYTLYKVGEYDDSNGILRGMDPERVITGLEAYSNRRLNQEKIAELERQIDFIKDGENPGGTN